MSEILKNYIKSKHTNSEFTPPDYIQNADTLYDNSQKKLKHVKHKGYWVNVFDLIIEVLSSNKDKYLQYQIASLFGLTTPDITLHFTQTEQDLQKIMDEIKERIAEINNAIKKTDRVQKELVEKLSIKIKSELTSNLDKLFGSKVITQLEKICKKHLQEVNLSYVKVIKEITDVNRKITNRFDESARNNVKGFTTAIKSIQLLDAQTQEIVKMVNTIHSAQNELTTRVSNNTVLINSLSNKLASQITAMHNSLAELNQKLGHNDYDITEGIKDMKI